MRDTLRTIPFLELSPVRTHVALIALTCAMLLLTASSASAGNGEKTHAVKPAELLAAIGQADKIVVSDGTPAASVGKGNAPSKILYSSASPRDI